MSHTSLRSRPTPVTLRLVPLLTALTLPLLGFGCGGGGGGNVDAGPNPDGGPVLTDMGPSGCAPGTQDADEDGVCEPDCASTACVNGSCEESTTTGLAVCTCEPGFEGDACDALVVPSATGVALWLDAADDDAFAFHSGQAVSTWTEGSASALDATSVDAATAPTRVAAALNGLPVVRFDGVDDELVMTDVNAFSEPTDGHYTIFMVMRSDTEGSGAPFQAEGGGDTIEFTAYDSVGDGTAALDYRHRPSGGFEIDITEQESRYGEPGWTHAEYHLVTIQRRQEGLLVWVDGNNQVSANDFTGGLDQGFTELLTLTFSPSNGRLEMDLAEMIVVSDDLHHGERRPYEDYLAAKWFGAAFERTPTAFGDTVIWLDAQDADGITTAGGGITSWANRGIDEGFFANGSFADARPTLVANGLSGHPVVRFDGGDALGQNTVSTADGLVAGEYAMVLVMNPPSTGARQLAFRGERANDSATIFRLDVIPSVPSLEFIHRVPPGDVGGELLAPAIDLTAPRIIIIERSATGTFTVRIDDTTAMFSGEDAADLLGTSMNWMLGGASIADPGDGLVGDIAEFIVMDNRLLAAEEEALVELLRAKWGL